MLNISHRVVFCQAKLSVAGIVLLVKVSECRLSTRGLDCDRLFMVVTDTGVCVSQKRAPRLCTVHPSLSASQLVLSCPPRTCAI